MSSDRSLAPRHLLVSPVVRVSILFVFHAIVFAASYAFSWLIRFEFDKIPEAYAVMVRTSFPIVIAIQLLVGLAAGFYRGWWRYVGIHDVVRLFFGMTAALVAVFAVTFAGPFLGLEFHEIHIPRGVLVIDWAFVLLTLFGVRLLIRLARDRFRPMESPQSVARVMIVGAGDAGETLAREIEHRPQLGMKVVAFVDDQRAKWGAEIRGVKVRGPISNIGKISDELQADEALIAIPSASGKRMREIIEHLSDADLKFKTIPGIDHLVSGKVHVTQLRAVNVEDLLRRKRIDLPGDPVRALFAGKRVLVTGAGGTIGSELASQVLGFDPERVVLVERSEYGLYEARKRLAGEMPHALGKVSCNLVDIGDTDIFGALLERERPQIVLHAAAHKHVPLGEENPGEYLRNNALATANLADLCSSHGVERFVFISTDKSINPTSVMGASKRAAEILLLDRCRQTQMKMTIVRFGNVIGSSGSVIPLFMEQIAAGGPVTVTHPDVTRYFIRTSEAISLVLQAATIGSGGHVFMLDMGEPIKIVDLARDLIHLSNHTEEEIPIVFTGMRPGEKMFEEIRLKGEDIRPTVHPHIVVTEAPQPATSRVNSWRIKATAYGTAIGHEEAVQLLRELVPEYLPQTDSAAAATPRVPRIDVPLPVGSVARSTLA